MAGTYSKLRKKSPTPVRGEASEPTQAPEASQAPEGNDASKVSEAGDAPEPQRTLKRKSYDLYADQIKTLSTQTKVYFLLKGQDKGVTQMVREAIDDYIEKYQ